jgi:PqqD family protein of HPr-rel-A system
VRRWRVCSGDSLHWRAWNRDVVFYSERTGATHLVKDLPAAIFLALTEQDLSLTELIDRLAATYEIVADRETTATIEAALDSLGALGAVDAVDRK